MAAPLALIASVPNYDCSLTVNQQQSTQPASASYTLSLANNLNISDVRSLFPPFFRLLYESRRAQRMRIMQIYASTKFEIKAFGSPYPASSSSAGASGTGTSTAGSASSTSGTNTGAASANYIPVGMSMAAALFLGLVVA